MIGSREIEYEHTVLAWTVGDLRRALDGLPDDAALRAITAENPGSDIAGDEQIVCGAGMGQDWVPPTPGKPGHMVPADRFELQLEFPAGTYEQRDGWLLEHTVRTWTVGELRQAIAPIPDGAALVATTADDPGVAGTDQVIYAADMGQDWVPPAGSAREGHWVPANRLDLQLEFPTGTYIRTVDDDES